MSEDLIASDVGIEEWRPDRSDAAAVESDLGMLGELLHAVVHTGAGVSFVVPFSQDEARAFWREKVLPGVRARTRRVRRRALAMGTSSAPSSSTSRYRPISNTGRRWPSCWSTRPHDDAASLGP